MADANSIYDLGTCYTPVTVVAQDKSLHNTHPIRFHNSLTESLMLAYASSSKPKYTDLKQKKKQNY